MFQFAEHWTCNYDEVVDIGYIIQADDKYPKQLHGSQNNLSFLNDGMKIKKHEKFLVNSLMRKKCFTHKNFKAGFQSWTSITKSTQSNNMQSKSLAEAMH